MMRLPLKFIVILVASVLAACTTQYYGYTQSQWDNMTPFEQEKAKVEWRQVIAAKEKGALGDSRAGISEGFVDHSKSTNENDRETNKQ